MQYIATEKLQELNYMSTEKKFEDMTNEELKNLVEDFDLKVDAKNPSKPNKTELIDCLNAFKREQDIINGNDTDDESSELDTSDEYQADKKNVSANKLPRQKRRKLQMADLMRKECVIITDTRTSQTPDKAQFVSWGNGLIGHHTDVVNFSGKPQYIRRGALANLRAVTLNEPIQEDIEVDMEWAARPRFMITEVAGLTQAEIKKKAVEQQIKAANSIS